MSQSNVVPAWIVAVGGAGSGAFARCAELSEAASPQSAVPVWWRLIDAAAACAPSDGDDALRARSVSLGGRRIDDLRRAILGADAGVDWRPTSGDFGEEGTRGVRARARAAFLVGAGEVAAALEADAAGLRAWTDENRQATIDLLVVADLAGGVGSALAVDLAKAALAAADRRGLARGRFRTIAVLTLPAGEEEARDNQPVEDGERGFLNAWCALREIAATIPEPSHSEGVASPREPARPQAALFDEIYVCARRGSQGPLNCGETDGVASAFVQILMDGDASAALRNRLEREEAVAPKEAGPRFAVTLIEAAAVGSSLRRREEAALGALAAEIDGISHARHGNDDEATASRGSAALDLLKSQEPRLSEALDWIESEEPWRANSRFAALAPPSADRLVGRSSAELRALLRPFAEPQDGIAEFIATRLAGVGPMDAPQFALALADMPALGLRGAADEMRALAERLEGRFGAAIRGPSEPLDGLLAKTRKRADVETANAIVERSRRTAAKRVRDAVRERAAGAVLEIAASLREAAERMAPMDKAVSDAAEVFRRAAKAEPTTDEERHRAAHVARLAAVSARDAVEAGLRTVLRGGPPDAESLVRSIVAAAREGLREAVREQAKQGKADAAELVAALGARRKSRWIERRIATEDGAADHVSTIAFSGLLAAAPGTNREELHRELGAAVDGVASSPSASLDIVVSFAARFDPFRLSEIEAGRQAGLRLAARRPGMLGQFLLRPDDFAPRDAGPRA